MLDDQEILMAKLKTAWDFGYSSFMNELELYHNPFSPLTEEFKYWINGWISAQQEIEGNKPHFGT